MIVGLDGFRAVNDIWGHAAGDEVLRFAGRAAAALRKRTGRRGARRRRRVRRHHRGRHVAFDAPVSPTASARRSASRSRSRGSSILLGASIGAALYPINAESGQFLFRAADSALSKAKSRGRNALAVFDTEMKERMERNATLERDMRLALSRDEFVVFYQPQLELATGRVRGYEALVRWERPDEGILAPRDFLARRRGDRPDPRHRRLGAAPRLRGRRLVARFRHVVAVNFSAAQFRSHRTSTRRSPRCLEETGLRAGRLEIEVPEHLFLTQPPEAIAMLNRIKALGVRVAMDDFGGGYTGLAALARFPFDKIKIDRTFVSQLTEDADVAAIVAAIVALGRTLSVDVTAEGVETNEQVTLLKAAGCSIVQGFLFGAPRRKTDGAEAESRTPAEDSLEAPAAAASA